MDQRSEPRLQADQTVRLVVLGPVETTLEARLVNLSRSGMRLLIDRPLPLSTPVRVDLPQALLLGEVCYCQTCDAHFAVGLQLQHSLANLGPIAALVRAFLDDSSRGPAQGFPADYPLFGSGPHR